MKACHKTSLKSFLVERRRSYERFIGHLWRWKWTDRRSRSNWFTLSRASVVRWFCTSQTNRHISLKHKNSAYDVNTLDYSKVAATSTITTCRLAVAAICLQNYGVTPFPSFTSLPSGAPLPKSSKGSGEPRCEVQWCSGEWPIWSWGNARWSSFPPLLSLPLPSPPFP